MTAYQHYLARERSTTDEDRLDGCWGELRGEQQNKRDKISGGWMIFGCLYQMLLSSSWYAQHRKCDRHAPCFSYAPLFLLLRRLLHNMRTRAREDEAFPRRPFYCLEQGSFMGARVVPTCWGGKAKLSARRARGELGRAHVTGLIYTVGSFLLPSLAAH